MIERRKHPMRPTLYAMFAVAVTSPALGQTVPATGNGSQILGTTPTAVFAASSGRTWLYLENDSANSSGQPIWWSDIPGVQPGQNVPGSRILMPGQHVEYNSTSLSATGRTYVPPGPITATSGAAGQALTAEAN
jgi:hypothetical protein